MAKPQSDAEGIGPPAAAATETFDVTFFVVEGFSMMALSSAVEPLRSVNRLLGGKRYSWTVAADRAGPVVASNGLEVAAAHGVGDLPMADLTLVVASYDPERYHNPAVFHWLRRLRAERRLIGAISNGAMLLARAGALDGRKVTIHWEMQRALAEEFPEIEVVSDLYCRDRGVLTAAGGTAAMDLMLALIAEREGHEVAADVSEQFLHGPVRPSTEAQRQDVRWRFQVTDRRLVTAIRLMEERKSDPLKIAQVADVVGISERQLERLFVSEFGKSPSDFYMELRLKDARNRLLNSTESLDEVAELSGFSSLPHFSRTFKAWCGESPSAVRRQHRRKDVGRMQEIDDSP